MNIQFARGNQFPIDENGDIVPEHFPYYSTTIFVPDSFTEEQMNELYVEEPIE